jgi:hypothetical protein
MPNKLQILAYWHKRIGTKTYSRKLEKELRYSINNTGSTPSNSAPGFLYPYLASKIQPCLYYWIHHPDCSR